MSILNTRISLDLFGLDIPRLQFDEIVMNGANLNLGVNGFYQINNTFGVQADLSIGYLSEETISDKDDIYRMPHSFSAGVFILPIKKVKSKMTKVILKSTSKDVGNTRYTLTKSLNVIAKHKTQYGLRAGLYAYRTPFTFDEADNTPKINGLVNAELESSNFSHQGIYAGIQIRKMVNIVLKTDLYGEVGKGACIDYFLDVMLPANSNWRLGTDKELTLDGDKYNNKDNISTLLKGTDLTKGSPIGGRFGFLLTDPALYSEGGHKRGMSTLFEIGYRPWTKWYTKVTLGIQLYKR